MKNDLNLEWKLEARKIKTLKNWEKNPRILTKDGLSDLAKSIAKFGLPEPLIIQPDGTLIGGHARLTILKDRGATEVMCMVPSRKLKEPELEELNIRLNKNIAGVFDIEKIANEFDAGIDELLDWGFDEAELDLGNEEEPEPPPPGDPPNNPKTKSGDVYLLDTHRLMCGDATNDNDMKKLMNKVEADMILTDPPYNVDYTGRTKDKKKIDNDAMSDDEFFDFLYSSFKLMHSHSKKGACIYLFHADSEGENFRGAFREANFKLTQCCIWVKDSMVLGRQDYHWQHEPILYGWKEGATHSWYSDRTQTTLWRFDRPTRNEQHPTMKPVNLMRYPVRNGSKPGDIVLDTFGGSGSTMIACEGLERNCYMMENSPAYCDVIVERWEDFSGKKAKKEK